MSHTKEPWALGENLNGDLCVVKDLAVIGIWTREML